MEFIKGGKLLKSKRTKAPEILTRGKYAYRRVGSFTSKSAATRYKKQTMHSLLVVADEPAKFDIGVKYHVYRRIV